MGNSASNSNYCPSEEFVYCANTNEDCKISGTVTEGYISYGAGSWYNLIPFSNPGGSIMNIECNDKFSPYGVTPDDSDCCYIPADIESTDISYLSETIINQNEVHNFDLNFYSMRFGLLSKGYYYQVIYNAVGECTNDFFYDLEGVTAQCRYGTFESSSIFNNIESWTICGNENFLCNGLSTTKPHWIKYGGDNHFYFRLVYSSIGSIPCNDWMGDPISTVYKFCWRSPPLDESDINLFIPDHEVPLFDTGFIIALCFSALLLIIINIIKMICYKCGCYGTKTKGYHSVKSVNDTESELK